MIELTEQQQQSLVSGQDEPIELIDPRTKQTYVLLPTKVFERVQNILEDEEETAGIDVGALIADAMREDDENDPLLESYQIYRGSNDSTR
jgi:hypothetical protein